MDREIDRANRLTPSAVPLIPAPKAGGLPHGAFYQTETFPFGCVRKEDRQLKLGFRQCPVRRIPLSSAEDWGKLPRVNQVGEKACRHSLVG